MKEKKQEGKRNEENGQAGQFKRTKKLWDQFDYTLAVKKN